MELLVDIKKLNSFIRFDSTFNPFLFDDILFYLFFQDLSDLMNNVKTSFLSSWFLFPYENLPKQ